MLHARNPVVTYNAATRKHVRDQEKRGKALDRDNTVIVRSIMSTINGRAWMFDKLQRRRVFSTPFTADPYQTAFNCGVQNEGLRDFEEVVRLCPDEYVLMMREANDRQLADASRRDSGPDAERDAGNAAEAQRIGIAPQRGGEEAPRVEGEYEPLE